MCNWTSWGVVVPFHLSFKLQCAALLGESKLPVLHCERKRIFSKCDKLKEKKGLFFKKKNTPTQDVVNEICNGHLTSKVFCMRNS